MIIYIIKSSACLAIFFLFYRLFLEKENMHIFKRVYLLAALITAFGIPLVTFTSYVSVDALEILPLSNNDMIIDSSVKSLEVNYIETILWVLYGLGVLFFAIKFVINLSTLLFNIRTSPKYKTNGYIHVLIEKLQIPHTFFSYIFINKSKFISKQIPDEVLAHEQAHAKQKHSFDVLFIELLQIVFWINPFIYFIKHAIKLNHEFLADQAVLNKGVHMTSYQHILLNFSSSTSQPQLANALNYSFIKKRFTIMKTQTSKRAIWFRSLLLLPLFTLLIYGFSEKITIQQDKATPEQVAEYNKLAKHYNSLQKATMNVKFKDVKRLEYIYGKMTTEQKKAAQPYPDFPPPPPPPPTIGQDNIKQGSRELQVAHKKFWDKADMYGQATRSYNQTKKKHHELNLLYNEVMDLHEEYLRLAKAEKLLAPPPPPPPPSVLDHIIELAKKEATFYYEGNKVSSDKAIAIVKNNSSINIQVVKNNSNSHIVKLSTKPTIIKKP